MTDYKALTFVMVGDAKKSPGSTITSDELAAAGQTDEDIQRLLEDGALSTDMEADLHPDHQPVPAPTIASQDTSAVSASDNGEGVTE